MYKKGSYFKTTSCFLFKLSFAFPYNNSRAKISAWTEICPCNQPLNEGGNAPSFLGTTISVTKCSHQLNNLYVQTKKAIALAISTYVINETLYNSKSVRHIVHHRCHIILLCSNYRRSKHNCKVSNLHL